MAMGVALGIATGCLIFFACFFVALCKERPQGKRKVVHLLGLIDGQNANGARTSGVYMIRRPAAETQRRHEAVNSGSPAPMQKQVAGRNR